MPPLIMFDLDQTLTESKQALTPQMGELIGKLLEETRVAVISGGKLEQFLTQVVDQLPANAKIAHLYLLPTSGAAMYEWKEGRWNKIYEQFLSKEEAEHITKLIKQVCEETGLIDFSTPSFGDRIEYRGAQVTLSALGQKAPIEQKQAWDPDKAKRRILQQMLAERLPGFNVGMGGATSVDVTRVGVDKAYGIAQIAAYLSVPVEDMLYVGDQLVPGGNDEPALRTQIKTHPVKDPIETAFFITSLLSK
jgi:phosphomannomutase